MAGPTPIPVAEVRCGDVLIVAEGLASVAAAVVEVLAPGVFLTEVGTVRPTTPSVLGFRA